MTYRIEAAARTAVSMMAALMIAAVMVSAAVSVTPIA